MIFNKNYLFFLTRETCARLNNILNIDQSDFVEKFTQEILTASQSTGRSSRRLNAIERQMKTKQLESSLFKDLSQHGKKEPTRK